MRTNYFVVVAQGLDPDADATYNAFYEAGCDDAAISWSDGAFLLSFHRDAPRFDDALISAYRDVTKAGATVTRFEPDTLVTLADIVERSGLSLAVIEELRSSEDGTAFPPPMACFTADEPLWDWSAVATWLQRRELVDRDVAIQARILWEANTTLLLRTIQGADFELAFGSLRSSGT